MRPGSQRSEWMGNLCVQCEIWCVGEVEGAWGGVYAKVLLLNEGFDGLSMCVLKNGFGFRPACGPVV